MARLKNQEHYKISDDKAGRMMIALREGRTLNKFGVKSTRLDSYFAAHPEYALEARPLMEANNKAAPRRKGDSLRCTTHCRSGLHLLTEENVFFDGTHGRKRCLACRRASSAQAPLMSEEVADKVKLALHQGASLGQITHGRPTGGGKRNGSLYIVSFKIIKRYRRENSDFDRFIAETIANNNSRGQRIRYTRERTRAQTAARREEANDYYKILAMLPASYPDKDDVVSAIFEDLLTGILKRDGVKARVQDYITAHNRMFPTKFAKFGDSPLVSLDEVIFDDGSATRGDTASRGLWD